MNSLSTTNQKGKGDEGLVKKGSEEHKDEVEKDGNRGKKNK